MNEKKLNEILQLMSTRHNFTLTQAVPGEGGLFVEGNAERIGTDFFEQFFLLNNIALIDDFDLQKNSVDSASLPTHAPMIYKQDDFELSAVDVENLESFKDFPYIALDIAC